jgi:hypothetical protein
LSFRKADEGLAVNRRNPAASAIVKKRDFSAASLRSRMDVPISQFHAMLEQSASQERVAREVFAKNIHEYEGKHISDVRARAGKSLSLS